MLQPFESVFTDIGSYSLDPPAVSTLHFDNQSELLWVGSNGGHVTSFVGQEMSKYSSFQTHAAKPVQAILSGDFGVLSLAEDELKLNMRRGASVFSYTTQTMREMHCMEQLSSGLILMGGQHKDLLEFDLERARVLRTTQSEHGCVLIRKHSQFVCCADIGGRITLREPHSLRALHTFNTHSVTLSDFDVLGNYMLTCGYSNQHSCLSDRFLMVFDMRMLKAVAPIPIAFSPYLLRFVPAFSSRFCMVSQLGKYQFLDIHTRIDEPLVDSIALPPGGMITSFIISSTSQAFAFGDNMGAAHLLGTCPEATFNLFNEPLELVDVEPSPSIAFNDITTSLSTIPPLPQHDPDEKLLSDWPEEFSEQKYRVRKPIDPEILKSMKMSGSVAYAQLSKSQPQKHNLMPYYTDEELDNLLESEKNPVNK